MVSKIVGMANVVLQRINKSDWINCGKLMCYILQSTTVIQLVPPGFTKPHGCGMASQHVDSTASLLGVVPLYRGDNQECGTSQ